MSLCFMMKKDHFKQKLLLWPQVPFNTQKQPLEEVFRPATLLKKHLRRTSANDCSLLRVVFSINDNRFLQFFISTFIECPTQHLFVHSQQWKHHNNVWNLFIVNNKDTRKTSLTLFWCGIVNFEQILHIVMAFPLLTLNNVFGVYMCWDGCM